MKFDVSFKISIKQKANFVMDKNSSNNSDSENDIESDSNVGIDSDSNSDSNGDSKTDSDGKNKGDSAKKTYTQNKPSMLVNPDYVMAPGLWPGVVLFM